MCDACAQGLHFPRLSVHLGSTQAGSLSTMVSNHVLAQLGSPKARTPEEGRGSKWPKTAFWIALALRPLAALLFVFLSICIFARLGVSGIYVPCTWCKACGRWLTQVETPWRARGSAAKSQEAARPCSNIMAPRARSPSFTRNRICCRCPTAAHHTDRRAHASWNTRLRSKQCLRARSGNDAKRAKLRRRVEAKGHIRTTHASRM